MKTIVSTIVTVLGLTLAVAAVAPSQWSESLVEWKRAIGPLGVFALVFVSGLLIGWVLRVFGETVKTSRSTPIILTHEQYLKRVRKFIESGDFSTIKVFGYTGETVITDLIRYDDRYKALEIRFLHRNWEVEAADERAQNESNPDLRPWNKADVIRRFAQEPWKHSMTRKVRHYMHQPIIKGLILSRTMGRGREALFTFYKWVKRPEEGGSQFKGTQMVVMHVSDSMIGGKEYIDYIDSQFEYEWQKAAEVAAV